MANPTTEFYAVEDYLGEPGTVADEQWRRIVIDGITTDYEVSDYGRVINGKGYLLTPFHPGSTVYGWLNLSVDRKTRGVRIDKLVLRAFDPDGEKDNLQPVHLNGDTKDCRLLNLSWGTMPTTPTKKPTKKRARTVTPPRKTPQKAPRKKADQVEVIRTYRLRDMSVTIDLSGAAEVTFGHGYEPLSLTAGQMTTLATLMGRVAEMNALMGVS